MEDKELLQECDCGFATEDAFEMFEHCGMEFEWKLKITKSFSFNLFEYLKVLNTLAKEGNTDDVRDAVQALTFLLFKVSEDGEFDERLTDMYIEKQSEEFVNDIERMLKNNG